MRREIVKRYEAGASTRANAAALGVSKTTVLASLETAGVTIRPRGGSHR